METMYLQHTKITLSVSLVSAKCSALSKHSLSIGGVLAIASSHATMPRTTHRLHIHNYIAGVTSDQIARRCTHFKRCGHRSHDPPGDHSMCSPRINANFGANRCGRQPPVGGVAIADLPKSIGIVSACVYGNTPVVRVFLHCLHNYRPPLPTRVMCLTIATTLQYTRTLCLQKLKNVLCSRLGIPVRSASKFQ
jgi:hypothetical protein